MTAWIMRRYPSSGTYEVSDGNGTCEEFATELDAWVWWIKDSGRQWGDGIDTEDQGAPSMPTPQQWAQVAVRHTSPATSQRAARTRAPGWDSGVGRAIRIMFEHRDEEVGRCCWDVEHEGELRWGKNGVRHERFYNLYNTKLFDPPLVEPALDANGVQYTRPGENGDPQDCYRINEHGKALYYEMERKHLGL